MKKIILASASPRRSELLNQIGVDFEVVFSDVEENLEEYLTSQEAVQGLALKKALSVAKDIRIDAIVIGADTVVVKEFILGKPKDETDAFNMIKSLQGSWHEVITGVSIVESDTLKNLSDFEVTRVKMRELSDSDILSYIKTGECLDKAGAYGIQGMGALLIEKIEGCYFNVVGLPLRKTSVMLEKFNIKVM